MLGMTARLEELKRHKLIYFLLTHLLVGLTAGVIVCIALLVFDVANLRTLIFNSPNWIVGLILLFGSFCGTFGSLAMGVAIMGLGDWSDHPDREY